MVWEDMRQLHSLPRWIGTAREARDLKSVLSQGIKAIIDLAVEEVPIHPTRELVYLRFPLIDGTGNPTWLLRSVQRMVEEAIHFRVPTLIACGAGMSRSPAVAAVAAAPFLGMEPVELLVELRGQGPIDVSPTLLQELLAARNTADAQARLLAATD
jgi:protein-tyrosine phosphatase